MNMNPSEAGAALALGVLLALPAAGCDGVELAAPRAVRAQEEGKPVPRATEEHGKNAAGEAERNWGQWRGPLSTGVAPHADPPVTWSEESNVRWKVPLWGAGHSTPVVWGDRVYVTEAVAYGDALPPRFSGAPGAHDNVPVTSAYESVVFALDRRDGTVLWRRTVSRDLPHEGGHATGSLASASPVTDGQHVYAFFGSRGLYCLDRDGESAWSRNLGRMQTKHGHGEGASPVLFGDTLVVNWDHEGQSFVVALDARTGIERWKADRDEPTSWTTPIVVEHEGTPQLIVPGTNRIRSYDLANGNVIWECAGTSANVVAAPVAADGFVYIGSSYVKRAMFGIRLAGATGDITTADNLVWRRGRGTPYVPSLLLYDESLYFLYHYQGTMTRIDAKSGADRPGGFRLPAVRNIYASPVGAAGRVYVTDLEGTTVVFEHDEEHRILAVNELDDSFSASAAVVGRELYLRGERFLYCIAEE